MRKYNREIVKRTVVAETKTNRRKVRESVKKKYSTKTINKPRGRRPRVTKGCYKLSRKGN